MRNSFNYVLQNIAHVFGQILLKKSGRLIAYEVKKMRNFAYERMIAGYTPQLKRKKISRFKQIQ